MEHPPVFVIGHWRSGTSHMHHLLAKGGFGYLSPITTGLPWESLGLGSVLRPLLEKLLPPDRLIDRMPIRPDSPQEDELALGNMTTLAFHHGLYFPEHLRQFIAEALFFDGVGTAQIEDWCRTFRYYVAKLSIQQGGRRLVLKNPPHTARVGILKELFPGAKFIHMIRNPYEVFVSMRRFYQKLLPWLALQPYELEVDDLILSTYVRLLDALEHGVHGLEAHQYGEVRFEDLTAHPMRELKAVYEELELDGFDDAAPQMEAYLESTRSYQRNRYRFGPEVFEAVEQHWMPWVERWGYARPSADAYAESPGAGPLTVESRWM